MAGGGPPAVLPELEAGPFGTVTAPHPASIRVLHRLILLALYALIFSAVMHENGLFLSYIDFMRFYADTETGAPAPQFLQLAHAERVWRFRLLHAHVEDRPSTAHARRLGDHAHPLYHLLLYTGGRNEFLFNGRRHVSRRGVLVFAGPGERHCFEPCQPGGGQYVELTFAYQSGALNLALPVHEMLSLLTGEAVAHVPYPIPLREDQTVQLAALFNSLMALLCGPRNTLRFAVRHAVVDLLAAVLDEVYRVGAAPAAEISGIEAVRRRIERAYTERLLITDLAAAAALSPGYFIRAFRKAYGMTPIAYQQQLRINAARALLSASNLRVKVVAARVGYSNEYLFSRTFRKVVGMPPREFRRQAWTPK